MTKNAIGRLTDILLHMTLARDGIGERTNVLIFLSPASHLPAVGSIRICASHGLLRAATTAVPAGRPLV